MTTPPIVVLGVGNPMRRDDGIGAAVIEVLARRGVGPEVELRLVGGEPTELIEAWRGRRLAVVVDAVRSGREPGTVHRIDADEALLPHPATVTSGHGFGVRHALALARAVDRCPDRLILHGIEAADVGLGKGLSAPVGAAVEPVVDRILQDVGRRSGRWESGRRRPSVNPGAR